MLWNVTQIEVTMTNFSEIDVQESVGATIAEFPASGECKQVTVSCGNVDVKLTGNIFFVGVLADRNPPSRLRNADARATVCELPGGHYLYVEGQNVECCVVGGV